MSKVARKRGKNNAVHRISRSTIMFFFDCTCGVTGSVMLDVVDGSRLTSAVFASEMLSDGFCGVVDIFQRARSVFKTKVFESFWIGPC